MQVETSSAKEYTLLVVDDDPWVLDLLEDCLDDFHILIAENATVALDIFKENRIDLILTDVWLQGVSGYDLMNLAKKINPDIPVVLMSGLEPVERMTVEGYFEGTPYCLEKPFDLQDLWETVSGALNGGQPICV